MTTDTGTLYYGDCLDVLRELPPGVADLVYLDPPFNSDRDYNLLFRADAQVTAFEDTWKWGPQAQREHDGILRHPDAGGTADLLVAFCNALGPCPMAAYLVMMTARLIELRRILKDTGSIWLHCDPTASHYLKIVLDGVFGAANFRNEVIWRRSSAHNSARRCGPVHDTLLFYSASDRYVWNREYRPYTRQYVRDFFRKEDGGGRYQESALTGAGTRKGASGLPWRGYDPTAVGRHWAIPRELADRLGIDPGLTPQEKLDALAGMGFIDEKREALPRFRQHLSSAKGVPLQDIWAYQPGTGGTLEGTEDCIDADVRWLSRREPERQGYPTQKPVGLLERIIRSCSNPGDLVLDPFCGCGTTVHAAQKLGRRWIGIDITHVAVDLVTRRMKDAFPDIAFIVKGIPRDVAAARHLVKTDGLNGRYEFQFWALSLIDAVPVLGKKKGADGGIDGVIWAYDSPTATRPFRIIVSVKSGKIPPEHIRALQGLLKGDVKMAVLLTLENPSRVMLADAVAAGEHAYPGGQRFPRIQILTIADLLDGTASVKFLDYREGEAMFRRARRESRKIPRGSLFDTDDGDGGGAGQEDR